MIARRGAVASASVVAVTALGLILAAALAPPGADRAGGDDRVVAELAGQHQAPALTALLRAARAEPGSRAAAQAAARALIAAGRAAGESRLVGAALGVLRGALVVPDAETLVLAATARQYQHDFAGALGLLDQAIALDPGHRNARLMRATIATVQGRLRDAVAECRALARLGAAAVAMLCQATAELLTDRAPQIAQRLAALTADPGVLGPELHPWALGLLGEIAAARGEGARAQALFAAVLAASPGALRERVILADLMLADGAAAAARDLLQPAPDTDGVLIRRVLAARALGETGAVEAAELARRVQRNLDLGLAAHAREEAAYFLRVADDPVQALARAQANWAMQHEREDAELLLAAALAAGQPDAAAPVMDWMAAEGVTAIPVPAAPGGLR